MEEREGKIEISCKFITSMVKKKYKNFIREINRNYIKNNQETTAV
jgi:hypothetical protein